MRRRNQTILKVIYIIVTAMVVVGMLGASLMAIF
jgi:hypothetical protein